MATTRLSPGVSTFEIDLTLSIAPSFLRQGAFAGNFAWGPVNDPVLINDENNLVDVFLKPTDENFKDWFLCATYLNESRGLRINRIISNDSYNAIVGGTGTGFTVDSAVINGEVSSVAINVAGTGYVAGDIVEVSNGLTPSEIRILTVSGTGAVLTVNLLSNGTGYVTTTGEATTARSNFQIKNDFDFEQNVAELPEIIAKFPGSYGSNLGFSIMRASEFYGSQFQDRFRIQPTATNQFFDGDGLTSVFTVSSGTITDADRVVTINNVTLAEGILAGQYSLAGTVLTINGDNEQFSGDDLTSDFTIVNASSLDLLTTVVSIGGNNLTAAFSGTGQVAPGFFDIDPTSGVLTIGTNLTSISGDGATLVYQVTTADTLTAADTIVRVDNVAFNIVAGAPAVGDVQITTIAGGFSFTFEATEVPNAGINNIEIEWGFPVTGVNNIDVTYGLPNGTNALKVFTEQTSVHAVVFDRTGNITGTRNGVLEVYQFLSTEMDALSEDGTSNYYIDAINLRTEYIRLTKEVTLYTDHLLNGGSNGSALTTSDYQTGYNVYSNRDDYDITYVIDPVIDSSLVLELLNICENRGDAVAYIGAPASATLNVANKLSGTVSYNNLLRSSSYGIMEPTWMQIVDRYNSKVRWIPTTGNEAGLYAKTHSENQLWTAAAGYNRGQIRKARKVSYLPNESERDELYQDNINFLVRDKGAGHFLFGQKTMLKKNSAFNRANVRFLSIAIKRGVSEALKFVLFEINDSITRANVRNLINPFMRSIQAGRGVYEYQIVCDERNNTPETIDNNELKVDIYIKPTRTIEFIQLQLVFTKTGAVFEELISSGAVN